MKNETCAAPDPVVAAEGFLESLTKPEKGCRFFHCYRTGMMRVAAKERSGVAFGFVRLTMTPAVLGIDLPSSAGPSYCSFAVVRLNRSLGSTPH